MIPFECPECRRSYRVKDAVAGEMLRCRDCEKRSAVLPTGPVWLDKVPPGLLDLAAEIIAFYEANPRRKWVTAGAALVGLPIAIVLLGLILPGRKQEQAKAPPLSITVIDSDENVDSDDTAGGGEVGPNSNSTTEDADDPGVPDEKEPETNLETKESGEDIAIRDLTAMSVTKPKDASVAGSSDWLVLEEAGDRSMETLLAASPPDGRLVAYYPARVAHDNDYLRAVKVVVGSTGKPRAVLHTAEEIGKSKVNRMPQGLAFSKDGNYMLIVVPEYAGTLVGNSSMTSRVVRLFDTRTWTQTGRFVGPKQRAEDSRVANTTAWAFSEASQTLAVAFGEVIRLYDVVSGRLQKEMTSRGREVVYSLAFFEGDEMLVAGDHHGRLRVWNVSSGGVEQEIEGLAVIAKLTVTPNGLLIATTNEDIIGSFKHVGVTCWRVTNGRLGERLWRKGRAWVRDDGKVFVVRENISIPGGQQQVPSCVMYDATERSKWIDLLPDPNRFSQLGEDHEMHYVGKLLVGKAGQGQLVVVNPTDRSATVIGELKPPPRPVSQKTIGMRLNLTERTISRKQVGLGERVVSLSAVGNDRVLIGRSAGQVELVSLPAAVDHVKQLKNPVVRFDDSEKRVWRDSDGRQLSGRILSLENGVVEFVADRKKVRVALMRLHRDDVMRIVRTQLRSELRTWNAYGTLPIEGRLVRYDPPWVMIQKLNQQEVRIALANLRDWDKEYLDWLEQETKGRLLGRFEQWPPLDKAAVQRMKTEEEALQGTWKITAGAPRHFKPEDCFVFVEGNRMLIPFVVNGQATVWKPHRFYCDAKAKPFATLDRYQDRRYSRGRHHGGMLHASIYERRGNNLRIEMGVLSGRPRGFAKPWVLKRVSETVAEGLY